MKPEVSVIIATKDRAYELETISLPSLAGQDYRDFEVVIWDASSDNRTQEVVQRFTAQNPHIRARYFRAPRVGLPAQRNDAVVVAKGEVLFFIDDDCEVSTDGIEVLAEAFDQDPMLTGAALPLTDAGCHQAGDRQTFWPRFIHVVEHIYLGTFLLRPWGAAPKVLPSGCSTLRPDLPGVAYQFCGGDMAYKREVFTSRGFLEEMQKFSGYAYLEDMQFSHALFKEGKKLRIIEKGYVRHHPASEARLSRESLRCSLSMFNRYLIWKTTIWPYSKVSAIAYVWSLLGEYGLSLLRFVHHPIRRAGYLSEGPKAIRAIVKDFFAGK